MKSFSIGFLFIISIFCISILAALGVLVFQGLEGLKDLEELRQKQAPVARIGQIIEMKSAPVQGMVIKAYRGNEVESPYYYCARFAAKDGVTTIIQNVCDLREYEFEVIE